jgi:uncharacterized membrane protein YfcA
METLYLVYLAYAIIGAVAGILAGLLGIGGGLVTVPALFFLFSFLKFPQAYVMHLAIGTSLAAMIFNTLSSSRAHHRRHAVLWHLVKKAAPALIVGGIIGAILANYISDVILEIIFGFFLCFMGSLFIRKVKPHLKPHAIPNNPIFSLIFLAIGTLSVILGLGGGVFSVPVLTSFRLSSKNAIGTSAAITCLMTIVGTIAFLIVGWSAIDITGTIGYIDLSAFFVIGIVSACFAPMGAKLAHELPDQILRRIFGGMLILTGISMLL